MSISTSGISSSWKAESWLATLWHTPLPLVEINFILVLILCSSVLSLCLKICSCYYASRLICPIKGNHHVKMSPLHHPQALTSLLSPSVGSYFSSTQTLLSSKVLCAPLVHFISPKGSCMLRGSSLFPLRLHHTASSKASPLGTRGRNKKKKPTEVVFSFSPIGWSAH